MFLRRIKDGKVVKEIKSWDENIKILTHVRLHRQIYKTVHVFFKFIV